MKTVEELNAEIDDLKSQLDSVSGTTTEVYSRIVGYYRSVRNWNRGKKNEFRHRKHYEHPLDSVLSSVQDRKQQYLSGASEKTQQVIPGAEISGEITGDITYRYFFRKNCPNCPPVADFLQDSGYAGIAIDVDTPEGMKTAGDTGIMSTPTVIFLNSAEEVVFTGYTRNSLEEYLAPNSRAVNE